MTRELDDLLRAGIAQGTFPGAAYAVGCDAGTWFGYAGRQTYAPSSPTVDENTLWDLASVTKVVATTPAAMILVSDCTLELDAQVRDLLPEFPHEGVAVRDLLLHRSGLPAYASVTDLRTRADVWDRICRLPLEYEPRTTSVYSCLGFVVLQHVLERVASKPLDALLRERLFGPLGMTRTTYNPPAHLRPVCAPTEMLPDWQRRLEDERGFVRVQEEFVQGDVHDPVACVMGGVSGNAGRFSCPTDLALYLRALLGCSDSLIRQQTVADWTAAADPDSSRALGWDTKSPEGSSAGSLFSASSFGHTGYTGTSVWIDPENRFFAALLTNRVHPSSDNDKIAAFRPRSHDAAFRLLSMAGS